MYAPPGSRDTTGGAVDENSHGINMVLQHHSHLVEIEISEASRASLIHLAVNDSEATPIPMHTAPAGA